MRIWYSWTLGNWQSDGSSNRIIFLERNIVMSDGVSIQKMRRATTAEKKEIFEKFASIEEDGMKFMTPKNFLVDYVGLPVECEGIGL